MWTQALIQWIAASAHCRDVSYFPFGDKRMVDLGEVVNEIGQSQVTCAELLDMLQAGLVSFAPKLWTMMLSSS